MTPVIIQMSEDIARFLGAARAIDPKYRHVMVKTPNGVYWWRVKLA